MYRLWQKLNKACKMQLELFNIYPYTLSAKWLPIIKAHTNKSIELNNQTVRKNRTIEVISIKKFINEKKSIR